ncbi:hypothetical protein VTH06DRAFT_207 [Thermothelomyces fergusii]
MANLPPRPVFTNFEDGAPVYSSRVWGSNLPSGVNPGHSTNLRHFHPYDRPRSTPTQASHFGTIPPWRRGRVYHSPQSGFPTHQHIGQYSAPFSSGTAFASYHALANTNSVPTRHQGVRQSVAANYVVNESMIPFSHSAVSAASRPASRPGEGFVPTTPRGSGSVAGSAPSPKVGAGEASPGSFSAITAGRGASSQSSGHGASKVTSSDARKKPLSSTHSPPASSSQTIPSRMATTDTTTTTTTTTNPIITLVPAAGTTATTTLAVALGPSSRTFLIATPVAQHFTAPWPAATTTSTTDNTSTNTNTRHIAIDLGRRVPGAASWSRGECEAHLEALHSLLRAMHDGGSDSEDEGDKDGSGHGGRGGADAVADLGVDALWRLGRLQAGLGLGGGWVARLRGGMERFVEGLGTVVGGWMDGWSGLPSASASARAGCAGRGNAAAEALLERAAEACLMFGWAEHFRVVVERMAFVCRDGEDAETGARVVLGPDGKRVGEGRVLEAITATRGRILDRVFAAAQQSLLRWTIGIGCRPCANATCNTNRIAALNVFLLWSGLYPRSRRLTKPLSEIVSALQYLATAENGVQEDEQKIDDRLVWAVHIRDRYGGTCNRCKEKTTTSMLFPLEDLLCDLSFEILQGCRDD